MEGVILDCSMTMTWCFKDERCAQSESLRHHAETGLKLAVPAIWPLEFINVLSLAERKNRIAPEETQRYMHWLFHGLLVEIELVQPPAHYQDILFLAREHNLTAYNTI